MKPPRKVRIGPYRVDVVFSEADMNERSLEASVRLVGQWSPVNCQIGIRPGQAPDMAAETMLHEVLHGVFSVVGLNANLDDSGESIIDRISATLLDTLRRNPKLVEYLVDDA